MKTKKKGFYKLFIISLLLPMLGACDSSGNSNDGGNESQKTSEKSLSSESGFIDTVNSYMSTQQDLMQEQADVSSQDFEDLSQHAKDVINSEAYKKWISESEKLSTYDVSGLKSEENYKKFQTAISNYDTTQIEYFSELAKAKTIDEYNSVNDKLAEELNNAQEDLFDVYNTLAE